MTKSTLVVSLGIGLAALAACGGADTAAGPRTVLVERGAVARSATATGRIEPVHEVPVKSRSGGVVTKLFVTLGGRVKRGEPIAEVRPVLTDVDYLAAERAIRSAKDAEATAQEIATGKNLLGWLMAGVQGTQSLERLQRAAREGRERAEEQLELLNKGQVEVGGKAIDYVVRAPADGHVIDLRVREGSPIVPSSSFGSGTVLVVLADMAQIVFRGTVDEIDVGRLKNGMTATIELGALPDADLRGVVEEIGLKAQRLDNAVTFAVRLSVSVPDTVTVRSGYSAVARIELANRSEVLVVPERVVAFRGGKSYVRVPDDADPAGREVEVGAGLSDGLRIEITSGLREGDRVLERS